ncbi:MAG: hypothetical protein NVS3B10_05160 [Polyangiales bacterium]
MRARFRPGLLSLALACLVAGCGSSAGSGGGGPGGPGDPGDASTNGALHVLWGTSFPGAGAANAIGVAVDSAGATVVVGSFGDSIDLGQGALMSKGGQDLFVAKLDPTGKAAWGHAFGDRAQQSASAVAIDPSGNIVVLGNFDGTLDLGTGPVVGHGPEGDVLLAKLDREGHALWAHGFGDSKLQEARALAVDREGNVVHVGINAGNVDFGVGVVAAVGEQDGYVAKVDASGKTAWARGFGAGGTCTASAVAIGPKGTIYVAGVFNGSIDLGSGPVKSIEGQDAFVVALDASGAALWSKVFGGPLDQIVAAIAIDSAGAILLAGQFPGPIGVGDGTIPAGASLAIAKLDGAGGHLWTRSFASSEASIVSLAAGDDGGLFRDGAWSLREPGGSIASGEFVHGLQEGRWIAVHPNGRMAWEARYVHGVPDGPRVDWAADGTKIAERSYRDGMLDGPVTIIQPDGTIVRELWRKGVRIDGPSPAFGADAR